jgi:WD40 repeat protein
VESGKPLCSFEHELTRDLDLSPDGTWLAFTTNSPPSKVGILNTRQCNPTTPSPVLALSNAFSRASNLLAVGRYGSVQLIRASDGAIVSDWKLPMPLPTAVAFSPDDTALAVGFEDGDIVMLDASTGRQRAASKRRHGRVLALAISPSGVIAVGGYDTSIELLDSRTLSLLATVRAVGREQAAVVTSASGRVEFLGDAAKAEQATVCRVGVWSLPWEACRDRLGRAGILDSSLRGEAVRAEER